MLSRYVGEYWDIFYYWWIDDEKVTTLENAQTHNEQLEILPLDTKYWPNYLKQNQ